MSTLSVKSLLSPSQIVAVTTLREKLDNIINTSESTVTSCNAIIAETESFAKLASSLGHVNLNTSKMLAQLQPILTMCKTYLPAHQSIIEARDNLNLCFDVDPSFFGSFKHKLALIYDVAFNESKFFGTVCSQEFDVDVMKEKTKTFITQHNDLLEYNEAHGKELVAILKEFEHLEQGAAA